MDDEEHEEECEECAPGTCGIVTDDEYEDYFDILNVIPDSETDPVPVKYFAGFVTLNLLASIFRSLAVAASAASTAFAHHGRVEARRRGAQRLEKELGL